MLSYFFDTRPQPLKNTFLCFFMTEGSFDCLVKGGPQKYVFMVECLFNLLWKTWQGLSSYPFLGKRAPYFSRLKTRKQTDIINPRDWYDKARLSWCYLRVSSTSWSVRNIMSMTHSLAQHILGPFSLSFSFDNGFSSQWFWKLFVIETSRTQGQRVSWNVGGFLLTCHTWSSVNYIWLTTPFPQV